MTTRMLDAASPAVRVGVVSRVRQKLEFRSGNEAAALAARDIGYHVMGYFPITPSTEVAENLSKMRANGEHEIVMIAGDGEHGAAGICYGAALGGGRVLNATSSQGLLYALEQLPVQAGTRVPMVLNIAARAISGPLDIRGDHSDIYYALNTGWIMLCARDPQAVYDDARRAREEFGFLRMWSIHPAQIDPILRAMLPDAAEIEEAAGILAAAQAADWAPLAIGGKMHDLASYRYHWSVLKRARAAYAALPAAHATDNVASDPRINRPRGETC